MWTREILEKVVVVVVVVVDDAMVERAVAEWQMRDGSYAAVRKMLEAALYEAAKPHEHTWIETSTHKYNGHQHENYECKCGAMRSVLTRQAGYDYRGPAMMYGGGTTKRDAPYEGGGTSARSHGWQMGSYDPDLVKWDDRS